MRRSFSLLLAFAALILLPLPSVAWAGPPGMPDPKQMSGMPRVDPKIPAGTITVRCLEGGFDKPAVGVDVTLKLTSSEGEVQTRTEKTVAQGRATFSGLSAQMGWTAVASVDFGGEVQKSQPMRVEAAAGTAVMLVKGARGAKPSGPHGGGSAHGPAGDIPPIGTAFPLGGERSPGMVVVGALRFQSDRKPAVAPVAGIGVRLLAVTGDGTETELATAKTDADGRVRFERVHEKARPEGSKLVAEAAIVADAPKRSEPFEAGEQAVAVILAEGKVPTALTSPSAAPAPAGPQMPQRMRLPPPRKASDLPEGSVRVFVLDGKDQPLPDVEVEVLKQSLDGGTRRFGGKTGRGGMARVDEVPKDDESLYVVRVVFDGAPYRSKGFSLPDKVGADVMLRVFPVTHDRTTVKSALQFEFRPRENDLVHVIQFYEVLVEGEKAYWPRGPMVFAAPDGAKSMAVLPDSEDWLKKAKEEDPFAQLYAPLPPGEPVALAIAYVVSHDGEYVAEFDAPFPLVAGGAAVPDELSIIAGHAGPREETTHQIEGQAAFTYALDIPSFEPGFCDVIRQGVPDAECPPMLEEGGGASVAVHVTRLPKRNPAFPMIGIAVAGLVALVAALAMVLRPRVDTLGGLEARRDRLLERLRVLDENAAERAPIIAALDRLYRQIDALKGPAASS